MHTYHPNEYENELRKLTHCEEDIQHPVTPYGRIRKQLFDTIEYTGPHFIFTRRFRTYGSHILEEVFYRALERIFLLKLPDTKKILGYKGDADGMVYEMLQRVRQVVIEKWVEKESGLDVPMDEERTKEAELLAKEVSKCVLLLYFDMEPKANTPNLFERCTSNDTKSLAKDLKRLFPREGYKEVGFLTANDFVQAYRKLRDTYNYWYRLPHGRHMRELPLIDPDPLRIQEYAINFALLTYDGKTLLSILSTCLKENSITYSTCVLQQWRETEHNPELPSLRQPDEIRTKEPLPEPDQSPMEKGYISLLRYKEKRHSEEIEALQRTVEENKRLIAYKQAINTTLDAEFISLLVSSKRNEYDIDLKQCPERYGMGQEDDTMEIRRDDMTIIRQEIDQLKVEKEYAWEQIKLLRGELDETKKERDEERKEKNALRKEIQELRKERDSLTAVIQEQTPAHGTDSRTGAKFPQQEAERGRTEAYFFPDAAKLSEKKLLQQVYGLDEQTCHIFMGAREKGLMRFKEGHYEWLKANVLLDYFLGRVLCDDLPEKDVHDPDRIVWLYHKKGKLLPAKKMGQLFNRYNIGKIRRSYHNNISYVPQEHELIDEIIKECKEEFQKRKETSATQPLTSETQSTRPAPSK